MEKYSDSIDSKKSLSVFRFVVTAAQPYRLYIVAQLFIHCMWALYVSLSSYLTKQIIDVVNTSSMEVVFSAVMPYALAYFFALTFIILLNRFYNWLTMRTMPLIEQHTLFVLSSQLIAQSYAFYQEQFAGGLANNVRMVANGVSRIIDLIIERIFRPFITLIVALWTVSQVSLEFAILLLGWLILFLIGSLYAAPFLRQLADISAARSSRVVGQLVDMITNMLTIRLFSAKKQELKRIEKLSNAVVAAEQNRLWFFLKLQLFQGILFILFIGISLWLLVHGYRQGWVTAGDFALILLLNESMNHLLWRVAQDLATLYEQIGVVDQGLSVIMAPLNVKDKKNAQHLIVQAGEIIFDHVFFKYNEVDLFNDLSLTIPAGQRVGLVGYSGSGKSTFVNLILRLFDVNEGHIFIDKQDIQKVTQDSLRSAIAFIPQNPTLFHRTIYENIAYARLHATSQEVYAAVKNAHADEFVNLFSQGYEAEVGEGGSRLSGGQRQRIAIARAFLKNAPILILDEATSQLDAVSERYIQESLKVLMQGKTTLVIAHRLSTLLDMERILVFDRGRVVQDGSHAKLLQEEGIYKTLWEHQTGGFLGDQKN